MKTLLAKVAARAKTARNRFLGYSLRDRMLWLFICGVFFCFVLLVLSSLVLTIVKSDHYFFVSSSLFFQDASDAFMDFFNVNDFVTDMNPYYVEGEPGEGSSYPPLALLLAKVFQLISGSQETARATRLSVRGVISLFVYLGVFYVAAAFLFKSALKGSSLEKHRKALFAALCFSAPMLFLLDRGNYVFYAVLLTAVFFVYRNADKVWVRELSYLALAGAAGIKLYPAAFALILLKERKFSAFFRTALYSIALFILPFFCFYGGWHNIVWFWENMVTFSGKPDVFYIAGDYYTNAYSYSLSVTMLVRVFYCLFFNGNVLHQPAALPYVGYAFTAVFIVVCLVAVIRTDAVWKVAMLSAVLTVIVPDPSYFYGSAITVIPFIAFLLEEDKKPKDFVWFALFFLQFMPLPVGYLLPIYSHGLQHGYTIANFVQAVSYLAFAVLLLVDGFSKKPSEEHKCS